MAEIDKTKFNLSYLISGDGIKDWWKAWGGGIRLLITIIIITLLGMGAFATYRFFFPKPTSNVNKPTINVGQGGTSNYTVIQNKEHNWETDIFGGGLRYDNKDGYFIGGKISYRW